MRYHEIVEAAEIPQGFKKSKKIVLADGRPAVMTIEHRPEDPNATEGGYEKVSVVIMAGDEFIGYANFARISENRWFANDGAVFAATNLHVNAPYRKQGLATAMYDFATKCGVKIAASGRLGVGGKLTPDGEQFWSHQQPEWKLGQQRKAPNKIWKKPKK